MSLFKSKLTNAIANHLISKKFKNLSELVSFYRKIDTDLKALGARKRAQDLRRT